MVNSNSQTSTTPLQSLQAAFCLIKISGDLLVVDRQDISKVMTGKKLGGLDFYKRPAGELLMKRFLENLPVQCDIKKTLADFWVNPLTHVYTDIAFSPIQQPLTTLNYWINPVINPKKGDWSIIRSHIKDVICCGNKDAYHYLIYYLAHMLKHPEMKPGVMVVLLGKQGTGKGLFFQILMRIWNRTALLVSDVTQILGQFNAVLERHYVIIMDEAIFSGDRKSQDRMKSLITEKTCHIEQKYQPSRTIDSVHRFFASSNHEHFSQVDADDRRSFFLRVSDSRQGDSIYFKKLVTAIDDDETIAAMIHDLISLDLKDFDVRARPKTDEHDKQKIKSLKGFDRYWFEVLNSGKFCTDSFTSVSWETGIFVATDQLVDNFNNFDRRVPKFAATLSRDIADAISRLCPSAIKNRKTSNSLQKRGYILPELHIARLEFERAFSLKVTWDENPTEITQNLIEEAS
jgi:Family of unknown function (DUF5906)